MTDHDLRPPQQHQARTGNAGAWLTGLVAVAVLGGAAWYGWDYWKAQHKPPAPPPSAPPAPEPAAPPAPEPEMPAPAPAPSPAETGGPQHPVPPVADSGAQPVEDAAALDLWAVEWLGKPALQFLVMPGLAHHIVATIDNLPRNHAAPRLWPLSPVGGKIVLEEGAQGPQIAPGNSARYDAVVHFVTGIDPAQAATWYRQAYPVLQKAYEDLGYPGKYFNDRLVEVIDHLLQTPEPAGPMVVELVQVQGQIAPQQPWLRYEFADRQLQERSAGQKILLRMGAEHRQRIKAYLQDLRAQITRKD